MVPKLQKPRVTEIQVRIDCNGCVQKIKKALHGISGICELYIDFPQQKITIVGWADPEKIVKAIKKTRKTAIICAHIEPPDEPAQPSEHENQGEATTPEFANSPPPTESTNAPPTEPSPSEAASPVEAPKDQPQQENQKPEAKPSPDAVEASGSQPVKPTGQKDVEEVHVIYHHPPDYGYRYGYNPSIGHGYSGQWHSYPGGPSFRQEPPYLGDPGFRHEPSYPNVPRFRQEPSYPGVPVFRQEPNHPGGPGFRHEPSYPRDPSFRHEPSYTGGQSFINEPSYHGGPGLRHEQPPTPGSGFRQESSPPPPTPPVYVSHSYNTHRATPYVTGYEYVRSPPMYTHYNQMERYNEDYYHQGNNANGNVTAIFSDENPNACTIV